MPKSGVLAAAAVIMFLVYGPSNGSAQAVAEAHPADPRLPRNSRRRPGGHAQRGQDSGMLPQHCRLDVGQVVGCVQRGLHGLRRLDVRLAKRARRKVHEPVVVHIDGHRDVRLPTIRVVAVNGHHRAAFLPARYDKALDPKELANVPVPELARLLPQVSAAQQPELFQRA